MKGKDAGESNTLRTPNPVLRFIGRLMLAIPGWKIRGMFPDIPKLVVIVAPHTSNWDFYFGLAAKFTLGIKAHWLGKHTLFRWPVKRILLWLGGIPIDRSQRRGVVNQLVEIFRQRKTMILGLAPEGTRRLKTRWKTGFYYTALKADIPILLGYIDYLKKEIGIGPLLHPSGDIQKDFQIISEFYRHVVPKKPHQFALPEVDELKASSASQSASLEE